MNTTDRRTFLKLMGTPALAAAWPANLQKALAIPPRHRTGTIADVEHIVILMQENRSFDHYFGTMRGVRGFADPRAVRLPSGKPVWYQPNGSSTLLPFRPDVDDLGQTFLPDPPHGWADTHAAWNGGKYDRWVPNKGVTTMTYHRRRDLPFQFALAEGFTICDNYFCSLMGPTDPNRYHMWTGWVGNDGAAGGPVITNAEAGYDWSTYPERLERAGISWKVYQDVGVGLDAAGFWGWTEDPYIGNYGDNSLLYFHQYQNALATDALAKRARTGTNILAEGRQPDGLMRILREDVKHDRLPQVSWIAAPEAFCEHPNWEPGFGAWYVSQVLDILASNEEVFSKTALFLTYDEEGGFFDHLVPPTPPQNRAHGLSTVSTVNEIFPGDAGHATGPYGLGIRVPMIVVSPWSKGGWVNSQLFDHTSLIRFLEARFAAGHPDLIESNITSWRRAVVGDLTTAFDFTIPSASKRVALPGTDAYKPVDLVRFPDEEPVPPAVGQVPRQEHGVKPARALPYTLDAKAQVAHGSVEIAFRNQGHAAAVFHLRSEDGAQGPWTYTVEGHKQLSETWPLTGRYGLFIHGPNGFYRGFEGDTGGALLDVEVEYQEAGRRITLDIANPRPTLIEVRMVNAYDGHHRTIDVGPGTSVSHSWTLARSQGWYDIELTVTGDDGFKYQFAGHVENGEDSTSDPLMGGLV